MGKALIPVSHSDSSSGSQKAQCQRELVVAEEQKGRGGPCKGNGDKGLRAGVSKKKKVSSKRKVAGPAAYLNRFKERKDLDLFHDRNGETYIAVSLGSTRETFSLESKAF